MMLPPDHELAGAAPPKKGIDYAAPTSHYHHTGDNRGWAGAGCALQYRPEHPQSLRGSASRLGYLAEWGREAATNCWPVICLSAVPPASRQLRSPKLSGGDPFPREAPRGCCVRCGADRRSRLGEDPARRSGPRPGPGRCYSVGRCASHLSPHRYRGLRGPCCRSS